MIEEQPKKPSSAEIKTSEKPIKRTGNYTTPEGVEEFYDENGVLKFRSLRNRTVEKYENGKLREKFFLDGSEEYYDDNGKLVKRIEPKKQEVSIDDPEHESGQSANETSTKSKKFSFLSNKRARIAAIIAAGLGLVGTERLGEHEDMAVANREKPVQKHNEPALTNANTQPSIPESTKTATVVTNKETPAPKESIVARAKVVAPGPAPAPNTASTQEENKKQEREAVRKDPEIKPEKPAPVVPLKPAMKTREELVAEIRRKISAGESVTASEASMHNKALMRERSRRTMQTGGIEVTAQADEMPKPLEGVTVTSRGEGGFNYVYNSDPNGINSNPMIPSHTKKLEANNPFHLSEELMEQVDQAYEKILEEIYPENTLKTWMDVKNKSAYGLMSLAEKKVPKKDRPLWNFLKKLETATGLRPKSGVRGRAESIERYIENTLQKTAREGKLREMEVK